jgi:hypothetical protein
MIRYLLARFSLFSITLVAQDKANAKKRMIPIQPPGVLQISYSNLEHDGKIANYE